MSKYSAVKDEDQPIWYVFEWGDPDTSIYICECASKKMAELICNLLNAHEDDG